jgi:Ca-activated chloride channel family protein
LLAFIFLVSALASPISYEQKSPNHRKGRDLVIALDTSGSMGESGYDKETKETRKFDTVLTILNNFILHRYDDNLGVVVFGNFAFGAAPLTYDRKSLSFILKYLDVGIAGDNTAIGDGLMQAIRLLKHSKTENKVIILLSDGYQNSGTFSPKDGVTLAKQQKIKIYTIGIGKKSDYDASLLEHIAKESGGEFFQAESAASMRDVYKEIDSLEPSPIRSQHYLHKTLLFDIPLFGAIVVLIFILLRRVKANKT